MREIAKEIEDSIDMYFSQLRKEAENSWTNAYKKAEDFYCRFLNKIYGWDLYNRNYFKRNESDIDLATNDKSITVQVTAQNDNKKVKIENTINGFKKRKIKQGYKSLYIAFFEDLSKADKETDFNDVEISFTTEKNILTPNSLKAHIQFHFTLQEQHELLIFLNQELFPLEQGIQSIATIQSIEVAFDREDEFYSNSKFLRNNWIILSNEVDQFAFEISDLIIDKCTIESKRQDFKTGALPELAKALKGKNGRKIIDKVTNL